MLELIKFKLKKPNSEKFDFLKFSAQFEDCRRIFGVSRLLLLLFLLFPKKSWLISMVGLLPGSGYNFFLHRVSLHVNVTYIVPLGKIL